MKKEHQHIIIEALLLKIQFLQGEIAEAKTYRDICEDLFSDVDITDDIKRRILRAIPQWRQAELKGAER